MKILFIGGTGNISASVSRLALERGLDLFLFRRGQRAVEIPGAQGFNGDIYRAEEAGRLLAGSTWDAVVDWIAYTPADLERDFQLFYGKTRQFIFISSSSAYQKPLSHPVITESTPLHNPFWEYSRNKIACENWLMQAYRQHGFPVTIVRPSHTYDTVLPLAIGGWTEYTAVERMKRGQEVIVHGDGTSLWTLTHAEDFARGFVGLLGNLHAIGHAFHITSDEALTWDQITHEVAAAAGVEAKIVHIPSDFLARFDEQLGGSLLGDKAHCAIFDNSKIKTFVPEYRAVIPFSEGIRRTLRWFEAEPARMRVVDTTNQMMERILAAYGRTMTDDGRPPTGDR